jgi:mannosyltransferase
MACPTLSPAEIGLAVLGAVAVVVFVLVGIGRPIWLDDAISVLVARYDFHHLVAALRYDNNLPAYYVLVSLWIRLFGESEPALRSLAVLFYLGSGVIVFLLGSRFSNSRRAGFYSCLLYVSSAQLISQAQSVRMYVLLGFLSAASLLLYFRIFVRQDGSKRLAFVYAAVNCAGMLTQVWFFFLLLGQFVSEVLWVRRGLKKFIAAGAASGAAFLALWGPAFLDQLRNPSTTWLPPFRPVFLIDILAHFYGGGITGLAVLLACASPLAVAAIRGRREFLRDRAVRILATILAACILAPMAVTLIKPIYQPARYSTVALPALAVLLGAILTRIASRPYSAGLCYALLIATMIWHVRGSREIAGLPDSQSDRATAAYIVAHAAPGDFVVFTSLTRATADYYFRRMGASTSFEEVSFPEELDRHPGWLDFAAMLERRAAFSAEARRLSARLGAASRAGKRIWVYCGVETVTEPLTSNLDSALGTATRLNLRGPYHEQLLVYGPRPGA